MKYGILEYKNGNIINIGDAMQIIAVLNIYRQLGIEDIIRINYYDLQRYEGEEVILPICFPFYGYNRNNRVTCFSDKIHPIFLSLSLFDTNLASDEIEYLKKFEPIGCRDEFTARGLREKGINAYLNGCMTLTLQEDSSRKHADKIYCIDVPKEFFHYIPDRLTNRIVPKTHIFKSISCDTDYYARELLKEYRKFAGMVITARMHAAIPCLAIGIPVIFIPQEFSYRFSWLEDILPVYLPDEWENIDWSGTCINEHTNITKIASLMLEIAKTRISQNKVPWDSIRELESIYNSRKRRTYSRGPLDVAINYILQHWNKEESIEYGIWGISQVASALIQFIEKEYPLAKLKTVIDANKTEVFMGRIPKKKEFVDNIDKLFIFITADAVNPYALEYFEEIDKNPDTFLLCWEHIKNSCKDILCV